MRKTIVFVSGHARSGKSTLMRHVKSKGYGTHSTSAILYEVAIRILVNLFGLTTDKAAKALENKATRFIFRGWWGSSNGAQTSGLELPHREFLITIAEKILVPVFGRELFSRAVVKRCLKDDSEIVFAETIGGEEFNKALDAIDEITGRWSEAQQPLILKVNVRSQYEEPEADGRKLLDGGLTINNNRDGVFIDDIDELLDEVEIVHENN